MLIALVLSTTLVSCLVLAHTAQDQIDQGNSVLFSMLATSVQLVTSLSYLVFITVETRSD